MQTLWPSQRLGLSSPLAKYSKTLCSGVPLIIELLLSLENGIVFAERTGELCFRRASRGRQGWSWFHIQHSFDVLARRWKMSWVNWITNVEITAMPTRSALLMHCFSVLSHFISTVQPYAYRESWACSRQLSVHIMPRLLSTLLWHPWNANWYIRSQCEQDPIWKCLTVRMFRSYPFICQQLKMCLMFHQ